MVLGGAIEDNGSFSYVNFDSADDLNPLNARALGDNENQPRPKHQRRILEDVVEGSLRKENPLLLAPNDKALAFLSRS